MPNEEFSIANQPARNGKQKWGELFDRLSELPAGKALKQEGNNQNAVQSMRCSFSIHCKRKGHRLHIVKGSDGNTYIWLSKDAQIGKD